VRRAGAKFAMLFKTADFPETVTAFTATVLDR
jgi:hypothetical protein